MATLMEFQCFQFQLSASIRIHIRNRKKINTYYFWPKKKSEKKRDMPTIKYRHHQSANRSLQLREKSPDSRALCYAVVPFFVAIFWFLPWIFNFWISVHSRSWYNLECLGIKLKWPEAIRAPIILLYRHTRDIRRVPCREKYERLVEIVQ